MSNTLVQQVREAFTEFAKDYHPDSIKNELITKQHLRDFYKEVTDVSPEDYNREHETAVINEVYSSL